MHISSPSGLPQSFPPSCFTYSSDPYTLDINRPVSPSLLSGPKHPEKTVTLDYDGHLLRGTLYLIPHDNYLDLHSRFFHILPNSFPELQSAHCEPWTLLHAVQGTIWEHVGHLPGKAWMQGVYDIINSATEPSFVAYTSAEQTWEEARLLGKCATNFSSEKATVQLHLRDSEAELIIALPSHRALSGTRVIPAHHIRKTYKGATIVTDYPPLAVHPSILAIAGSINEACKNKESNASNLRPKKGWLKNNVPQILGQDGHLTNLHPIWKHRGNEFLFRREVWCALCYPLTKSEITAVANNFEPIPAPYYQVLFADAQVSDDEASKDVVLERKMEGK